MKRTDQEKVRVLNQLVSNYGVQSWWEDDNRIKDWVSMILIQQILLQLVIQFQKIQHILKEMFQLNGLMKMGLMLVTVILTHLLFLQLRKVLRFTDIKLL